MASSVTYKKIRLLLAIIAAAVYFFTKQHFAQMDPWLFQPSLQGAKALVLYTVGNLNGAATTYRGHFKTAYDAGRVGYDPTLAALLAGEHAQAKALALSVLAKQPDDIQAELTLAEVALAERRYSDVWERTKHVLKLQTDQADALMLASLAFAQTQHVDEAIDAMNRTLRHARIASRPSIFFRLLETTGDLEDLPRDQRPLALLANYYRYLRIHDEANGRAAIRYATRAVRTGDRPADAYVAIGIVYEKQDKPDEAFEAFLKAIEQDPKHAEALRWTYRVYLKRGDLLNAYHMARAAFEAAPDDPFYEEHLNTVLVNRLGNFREAEPLLERAVQMNPTSTHALWSLGYVYGVLGKHQESLECFQRAVHLDPKKTELYEELGHALVRLRRKDEAVAAYRQAIGLNPTRYQSHTALALYYTKQFRYREALQEYEEAFRLGEHKDSLRVQMCIAYHVLADFQRSIDCLHTVLARDPKNEAARHLLPEIQHNLDLQRSKS